MKLADTIQRAGRSLLQAKVRTLLTSLAIGVGAFTITLSFAAGAGGKNFTQEIVNANTDAKEIAVSKPQPQSATGPQKYSEMGSTSSTEGYQMLTDKDISQLSSLDHVTSVVPSYSPQVQYIQGKNKEKYKVSSIQTFSPGISLEYKAGTSGGELSNNEIILTEEYAKALGYNQNQDAIGETVTIHAANAASLAHTPKTKDFSFIVKAVSSPDGFAFRSQGSLLLSQTAVEDIYDFVMEGSPQKGTYYLASVNVEDAKYAKDVKDVLVKKGYEAQTATDILGSINTFINVLMAVLIGFGVLAIITSIFGIVNTQYISVLERTQQIGLMKALGARGKDVGRLFRFEAAWIGFLGGAIGAGLAIFVGSIANPIISEKLDLGSTYLLIFQPFVPVCIVLGLMIVAMIAGYFPARKAAKLDPIEALRTE